MELDDLETSGDLLQGNCISKDEEEISCEPPQKVRNKSYILNVACKNVTLFKKSFVFAKKSEVKVPLEILKADLKDKSHQRSHQWSW